MRSAKPGSLKLLSMRKGRVQVWSRWECEISMSLTLACCLRERAPETHPASIDNTSFTRKAVIPWPGVFPP